MDARVLRKEESRFVEQDIRTFNQAIVDARNNPKFRKYAENNNRNRLFNRKIMNTYGAEADCQRKFELDSVGVINFITLKEKKQNEVHINKYRNLAAPGNGQSTIAEYSEEHTNRSAYKRKKNAKKAAKKYEEYNNYMNELNRSAGTIRNVTGNSRRYEKTVINFYQKLFKGLGMREDAMLYAAKVKSVSDADENFRNVKIKREIIMAKIKLTDEYKYSFGHNTDLLAYFRTQKKILAKKLGETTEEYFKLYYIRKNEYERENNINKTVIQEEVPEVPEIQEEKVREVQKQEEGKAENRISEGPVCESDLTWDEYLNKHCPSIKDKKDRDELGDKVLYGIWSQFGNNVYFAEKYRSLEAAKRDFKVKGFKVFSPDMSFNIIQQMIGVCKNLKLAL